MNDSYLEREFNMLISHLSIGLLVKLRGNTSYVKLCCMCPEFKQVSISLEELGITQNMFQRRVETILANMSTITVNRLKGEYFACDCVCIYSIHSIYVSFV